MTVASPEPAGVAFETGPEPAEGNYFVAAYPPFSAWRAELAPRVHDALGRPMAAATAAPFGIYVHVPFCARRCHYCYYLSYAGKTRDQIDAYLDALLVELAAYARQPALAGRMVDFVYLGGGTPSLLSPWRIRRLLGGLAQSFPWNAVREVTFEGAPKTVTLPKLVELREAGQLAHVIPREQIRDLGWIPRRLRRRLEERVPKRHSAILSQ